MRAHPMDDAALLALWESALCCNAWQREDLLVAAAVGAAGISAAAAGTAPTGPVPLSTSLGERNAALLRWRHQLCGRALPLRAACPRCRAELEFELDTEALCTRTEPAPGMTTMQVGSRRVTFRLPQSDEVRELAGRHRDADSLATALLMRCVCDIDGKAPRAHADLDDELRAAIAQRMEMLDPRASLGVALRCIDCGHDWDAPLDVAALLWPELRRRAEQVLLDVALLARAFGWTEPDVLAMSPTRRAAYLQLAQAD